MAFVFIFGYISFSFDFFIFIRHLADLCADFPSEWRSDAQSLWMLTMNDFRFAKCAIRSDLKCSYCDLFHMDVDIWMFWKWKAVERQKDTHNKITKNSSLNFIWRRKKMQRDRETHKERERERKKWSNKIAAFFVVLKYRFNIISLCQWKLWHSRRRTSNRILIKKSRWIRTKG